MITDLSNGGQASIYDELAIKFLTNMGNVDEILENLLIPGLYSSPHNGVCHDYLKLRKKYALNFDFDQVNWLVYITEDLDVQGRQWSSREVENQQRGLLKRFEDGLSKSDTPSSSHQDFERLVTQTGTKPVTFRHFCQCQRYFGTLRPNWSQKSGRIKLTWHLCGEIGGLHSRLLW